MRRRGGCGWVWGKGEGCTREWGGEGLRVSGEGRVLCMKWLRGVNAMHIACSLALCSGSLMCLCTDVVMPGREIRVLAFCMFAMIHVAVLIWAFSALASGGWEGWACIPQLRFLWGLAGWMGLYVALGEDGCRYEGGGG